MHKKNNAQRPIFDARWSNSHWAQPDDVHLATGQSFAGIEVDSGSPVWLGEVDIANCFYTLELPSEFRPYFALPSIRAGDAGVAHTVEGAVASHDRVFPCLRVVPMGWNHALGACQMIHESMVTKLAGLSCENQMKDGFEVPRMNPIIHTEYVDNFVAYGVEEEPVRRAALSVNSLFEKKGLPTHGVDCNRGGKSLGWEFSSEDSTVGLNPHRLWRLRLAIDEVLRRDRLPGWYLESLVGHLTFAGLLRREYLSVFGAVYAWISKYRGSEGVLWPAVRRELKWASSLLPLLQRDLGAKWSEIVTVSDASLWGRGVVEGKRDPLSVAENGRVNERWRYSKSEEQGAHARLHCELQNSALHSQAKDGQRPESASDHSVR